MRVNYKPGSLFPSTFDYQVGDHVTIVVQFWRAEQDCDIQYYHGMVTKIDKKRRGFWAVLEDDATQEEFFSFADLEGVIDGDRIPVLTGIEKRSESDSKHWLTNIGGKTT